ncbi:MAG: ATP-binding protein [Candidatus Omnitrophica bacterium]|nr:ATP-binding protein [Candidatus Omnitrophota bacterium]
MHNKATEFDETTLEIEKKVRDFLKDTLYDLLEMLSAESGSLLVFDAKTKELVVDSYYSTKQINIRGIRFRLGEGVSGKIAAQKTPVLVKDVDRDNRFGKNGFKHYHTKSFISLPVSNPEGGVLGVINIADKTTGESFSEQDFKYACLIAEYAGLIAYNIGITERLKKEKENLDKQKMMLEKYASVGKLAAHVVHEVNNPLDGIIRYTNMLLKQIDSNSIVREYLLEIKRGLNRIENVTKSLLQFSYQVNQAIVKPKTYLDIHALLDETIAMFSERIKNKIEIVKEYYPRPLKVLDIGISHVFINIIKNALDAMPEKGILKLRTEVEETVVKISIQDNGPGIPEDIREKIFDAFFTTKHVEKGTGLGLAICKEIMNKYDGSITVESAVGYGSTFHILIPRRHIIYG